MSDAQHRASAASRRNPLPFALAAVLLAFLAGLAIMALVSGRYRWPAPSPVATPRPVAAVAATSVPPRPVAPAAAMPAAASDPVTLATRETLLGAHLAAIEARIADVDANAAAASGQAGRAEAMLLAFAARRAVDRGLGLGELERPFRARFAGPQPRATALVIDATRHPVTLEDLRGALEALAPDLVSGGAGWWSGLRGELGSLVVIHPAGTPSPVPADRLARIRRLVELGQVEAALAEVARMPGAAQAGNWTAAARRYAEAHRALDAVEAAALAPPPPLPPAAPAPASIP